MRNFGKIVKTLRKNRNLTQAEFAEIIQISRSQVNNLENGYNEPDLSTLTRIADFFNISVDVLLDRTVNFDERVMQGVLSEIKVIYSSIPEDKKERFCKQMMLYASFLANNDEIL